jgi:YjbE family integral membrane protein
MVIPFLLTVGGLLLLWIAIKLLRGDEHENHEIAAHTKLWQAVRTIAMADAVMSLDNVIAIVGAAGGDYSLFIFGLALSIPLIIVGASLITGLIRRFPIFVWAGAALLGWIAGEMIVKDSALHEMGLPHGYTAHYVAAVLGAGFVVLVGWVLKRRNQAAESA